MPLLKMSLVSIILSYCASSSVTAADMRPDISNFLIPIILTLEITESDKNNPKVISVLQDNILRSLKSYRVESVQRFRYSPSLALSVEQAGLDFLKTSKLVHLITQDGLNSTNQPQRESKNTNKPPCLNNKLFKD